MADGYMPQPDGSNTCCDCPDRTSPCDDCVAPCSHPAYQIDVTAHAHYIRDTAGCSGLSMLGDATRTARNCKPIGTFSVDDVWDITSDITCGGGSSVSEAVLEGMVGYDGSTLSFTVGAGMFCDFCGFTTSRNFSDSVGSDPTGTFTHSDTFDCGFDPPEIGTCTLSIEVTITQV